MFLCNGYGKKDFSPQTNHFPYFFQGKKQMLFPKHDGTLTMGWLSIIWTEDSLSIIWYEKSFIPESLLLALSALELQDRPVSSSGI